MEKKILLPFVILMLAFVACNSDKHSYQSDEDAVIDLESAILLTDDNVMGEMPTYISTEEGESVKFERSFENAPPMIPHKVTGLLPITISNNECLRCHMSDKIRYSDATPMPRSHYVNYRPEFIKDKDIYIENAEANEVVAKDLGDKLCAAMFNCTQCHAPQTEVTVDISNIFVPDFRDGRSDEKSNLYDNMDEGVK